MKSLIKSKNFDHLLRYLPYVLMIVLTPSLFSGLLWDDFVFIFKNDQITIDNNPFAFFIPGHPFQKSWPLGYFIFWCEYHVFGDNPLFYKILLLLIHGINIFIVDKLFIKLNIPKRLFAVCIFAIHPLLIESVSWVFQQNTLISTMLALLTLLYFEDSNRRISYRSLGFFILSLLVKPYAIALPIYLGLHALYKGLHRKWLIIFFILGSIASLIITQGGITSSKNENSFQEKFKTQVILNQDKEISNNEHFVITKGKAVLSTLSFYTFSFLFPLKRALIHNDYFSTYEYALLAFWIVFTGFIIIKGSLPVYGLVLLFLCIYVPFSGLVYIPFMKFSLYSDRWAYFMIVPLSALLAHLANIDISLKGFRVNYSFMIYFVTSLVLLSFNYSLHFNNHEENLWSNINNHPKNRVLYHLLLDYYDRQDENEKLLKASALSIENFPQDDRFLYYYYKAKNKISDQQHQ